MYYSSDSGETSWQLRAMSNTPTDFEVESAEVAYALRSNGYVEKTTNAGFIWGSGKSTKLGNGASIVSLGEGNLIVGGTAGYVSYSTDSGSTWTKLDKNPFSSGDVQVTASGLADGDFIYAGTSTADQDIKRWEIGESTKWTDIIKDKLDGSCYGLVLSSDGTLYAATNNTTDSALYRNLSPSTSKDTTTWSSKTSTADFTLTPRALKLSAGKLWVVDAADNKLYSLTDTVSTDAVTITAPADGATIAVNPATGYAEDVAYNWSRISKATEYDLDIALDSGFDQKVRSETGLSSTASTVVFILGPYSEISTKGKLQYMAGNTYYWRVRASSPVYSPWSETRSFTVAEIVEPITFEVVAPAVGATDVSLTPTFVWNSVTGAVGYEMVVSEDPTFAIIEWGHNTNDPWYRTTVDEALAYSTTYYWRARAILGESVILGGKAAPTPGERSQWAAGILTTGAVPEAAPAPTVIVEKEPAPPAEVKVVEVPGATEVVQQAIPGALLWAIIGIGAALVIALIVLIVRTRRVA